MNPYIRMGGYCTACPGAVNPIRGEARILLRSASKRLQIFHQIGLLILRELERERRIIVVYDIPQRGEPAIVVEAPLLVREEPPERRGPVALVRRSARLEVVDPNFLAGVHVPPRLGEQRGHVAARALGRAV